MKFTAAELEEMRRADVEIETTFRLTQEDLDRGRALDRVAKFEAKDQKEKRKAAQQKAWYEANREKVAAQQKAWYEANREKVAAQKKAYREVNREKYNTYMRDYSARRRHGKKEAPL